MKEAGDQRIAWPRVVRHWRNGAVGALRRNERGLAAVEFALLAIPFFMLLMAIIEIGIFLVVNRSLSNAMTITARQVRVGGIVATGKATTTTSGTALSPADFKAAICTNVVIVSRPICTANLRIDVRTATSFTGSIPTPMSGKSFSDTGFCYYSGVPGEIVELRAFYLWPLVTPLLWPTLASVTSSTIGTVTTAGHWVLASAISVAVNEPNGTTTNNGSGC